MEPIKEFYEKQAATIIKHLEKRGMEGYYCTDSKDAVKKALSFIPDGSGVSWGGAMTLDECGIMDALKNAPLQLIDRSTAKTPEEVTAIYHQALSADYYLMSTNAITLDGQLVNIDGNGNRAAALVYGPSHVIIIAGMNKAAINLEAAVDRARNQAAPPNAMRLGRKTPCQTTGVCANCLTSECICAHMVTTRFNRIPGRIKIILVGETLGY